jgi:addiction module RelB/DinJ family antitoxin
MRFREFGFNIPICGLRWQAILISCSRCEETPSQFHRTLPIKLAPGSGLYYNCSMTEVFQCRIDKQLVAKARKVAKEIGTTPGEIVRLMFVQMVKRRAIPFPLKADSPEDEAFSSPKRRAQLWDEL